MANGEIEGPAPGSAAVLIIDMITDLDFESGEALRAPALAVAERIAHLKEEAERLGVPVVYVNDNHGQWHAERSKLVEHCLREGSRGADVVRAIAPDENDYFVVKPQFSGFYSTNLPVLLPKLKASRLVLTGVAADMCVLFTAADAHMRDYQLWVPEDTVASADDQRTRWALDTMAKNMSAETRSTADLSLEDWLASNKGE